MKRRQSATSGDDFRRNRTQEVVGSSPTSSMREPPEIGGFSWGTTPGIHPGALSPDALGCTDETHGTAFAWSFGEASGRAMLGERWGDGVGLAANERPATAEQLPSC